MIHTEYNEPDYKSFLIQCDCHDIGHVARIAYYLDKDEKGLAHINTVSLEIVLNPYLPWYSRIWRALLYIIHPSWNFQTSYYDSLLLNLDDVRILSNIFFCIFEEETALRTKYRISS